MIKKIVIVSFVFSHLGLILFTINKMFFWSLYLIILPALILSILSILKIKFADYKDTPNKIFKKRDVAIKIFSVSGILSSMYFCIVLYSFIYNTRFYGYFSYWDVAKAFLMVLVPLSIIIDLKNK